MWVSDAKATSIAFVDDHPTILLGFTSMFSDDPGFEVVASGGTADEAVEIARVHEPEILFMDMSMPGDVLAAISEIAGQSQSKVIVVTAFSSVDSALRAIDAGAMGFVPKGSSFDDLFDAIETVKRGDLFITSQYLGQVMNVLRSKRQSEDFQQSVKLSIREKQILRCLLDGNTNKQIASALDLHEQTVKNYMSAIMAKLKARNRLEAVIEARKHSDFN